MSGYPYYYRDRSGTQLLNINTPREGSPPLEKKELRFMESAFSLPSGLRRRRASLLRRAFPAGGFHGAMRRLSVLIVCSAEKFFEASPLTIDSECATSALPKELNKHIRFVRLLRSFHCSTFFPIVKGTPKIFSDRSTSIRNLPPAGLEI